MTHRELWRDNKRLLLQVGLFATCCCLAAWIHAVVLADTLSDLTLVVLQVGGLLSFVGAAAVATRAAFRPRGRLERVALRLVPLGFVLAGATFAKTSYAHVSVALHELTAPPEGDSNSIVVLGPGGRDVRLSGELAEGTAARLATLLAAHPHIERIHLTSEGGLVDEGTALAVLIAAHRLTTFVPDYCVSACTLAFLGGRERLVMAGARLGFHAPYEEGLAGQTFATDKTAERAAYIADGVAADFVDRALEVAPDDIWTPEPERLVDAHVATGVVGRYRFPDSNLDGMATLRGARETVLRNFPSARALETTQPRAIDAIAAWYFDAYRRGASEGQVVDEIRARVAHATQIPTLVLSAMDGAH